MGSQEPGQEWIDAYRYQLATMAYAAGAAHYHRLPLLRSPFKKLMEGMIRKMLLRDVWGYWFLTSHGGVMLDPDLKELRKPWADPVVRENIMYSGHLLLMVSLYAMLFDDDRFDKEGGIAFHWNPVFWGMGPETFSYSRKTLQDAILKEMEQEKWIGVCCEPNSIFVVCNQFPLIAIKYNDVRDEVDVSPGVLEKYRAAWAAKGMVQEDGLLYEWYSPKQDRKMPTTDVSNSAWAIAFMNSWNPEFAQKTSENLSTGFLAKPSAGNHVIVPHPKVSFKIRELAASEGVDPMDPETFSRAAEAVAEDIAKEHRWPWTKPHFAYALLWRSELGDRGALDGMLAYADDALGPRWEDGGLFYPAREGEQFDYEAPGVDVLTGNAAVAYARLNIPDGQRNMYENPWGEEHFATAPFMEGVEMSSGVDFLRGSWDGEVGALAVTVRSWDGTKKCIQPSFRGLPDGRYGVYENGVLRRRAEVRGRDSSIVLDLEVSGEELDVVILKA
ncbi:hypothetical protein CSOJ01_14997 [Colletotrichum sojae]|uniref:Linalool dehydratase/isomerase domain-containing protein n=1 Tax=Colletotrichum sojae TaxID=2175907 RepID=A0A8H6MJA2_9PEZI|nr:hypothetical protein CSOJ01_14997 [Colletotrichum sojae]